MAEAARKDLDSLNGWKTEYKFDATGSIYNRKQVIGSIHIICTQTANEGEPADTNVKEACKAFRNNPVFKKIDEWEIAKKEAYKAIQACEDTYPYNERKCLEWSPPAGSCPPGR